MAFTLISKPLCSVRILLMEKGNFCSRYGRRSDMRSLWSLVISLDLHVNVSPEMVDYAAACQFFGLFRTWIWPIRVHDVQVKCGICLTLRGMKKPFMQLCYLIHLHAQGTDIMRKAQISRPAKKIMTRCVSYRVTEVRVISRFSFLLQIFQIHGHRTLHIWKKHNKRMRSATI